MQNLNQITLIGRVGADPESQEVNGSIATKLRVATNRVWKDAQGEKEEATTWHRVVAWGKTAETVQNYCKKGMLVFVTGSMEHREYQDKQGEKKTISEVKAYQVGFLTNDQQRSGGTDPGFRPQAPQQRAQPQARPQHGGQQGWGQPAQQDFVQPNYSDDVPF